MNYKIASVSCLFVTVVLFSACSENKVAEKSVYRIGALLALSGQNKSFGITQQRGLEMAVEKINSEGGILDQKLEVEYGDTQLNEDKAVQEYKRLTLERGVNVIVGVTGSGVALKLAPSAERDKVVLLSSLDTSPKLTEEGGRYFFRNIASDAYAGVAISNLASKNGHVNSSIIYNSENSWANGCRGAIEVALSNNPTTNLIRESLAVVDSTDEFSSSILELASNPVAIDSVYVCLMGRQAGLFVAQAKTSGLSVRFYGTDSFSQQEYIDNAADSAEFSSFVMPADNPSAAYLAFSEKYEKQYNEQVDSIAAKAYDALLTLANALNTEKEINLSDGEAIRNALAKTNYLGITGENSFDENGDLKFSEFSILTYKDGKMIDQP